MYISILVKQVYWCISQVSGERLQDHWSSGFNVVFSLQMYYKMRFKVSNPTAMDMPQPNIPPDGKVPNTLTSKSIMVYYTS